MSSQHLASLHRPQLVPPIQRSQAHQNKPTLATIRGRRNFDICELAKKAGVANIVVTSMLDHRPVYPAQARKVLSALSLLHSTHYDMRAIDITLFQDKVQQPYQRAGQGGD